ncbi:hypothetical protein Pan44_19240 [Caulifigura coniformis]|uniref:Uncharacterized protein n=2 Tax=Caulifigura coniformis TaxID=2527983 RepID=A0A517SCP4_9PLAN|nr:hypothetical protein Pan44_19240 [Caulifigura coniformis]
MPGIDHQLRSAESVTAQGLSSDAAVVSQLEQLRHLCLAVCPDCLVQRRTDKKRTAVIFVVPALANMKQDKNLMTVWPGARSVRLRIMFPKPSPREEALDQAKLSHYCERMLGLLINLGNSTTST